MPPAIAAALSAVELPQPIEPEQRWSLDSLAGHLCELTNPGRAPALSLTAVLVLQAQERGQPVAWIASSPSCFFAPDMAAWGIDLEALPVIQVEGPQQAARAADHLLRSGSFGLLVMDLLEDHDLPIAAQSRLLGLARRHRSALLCLTQPARGRRRTSGLGSLVSLRVSGEVHADGQDFVCELQALKDKRNGPGWRHRIRCRGSEGLS
jgi:recombination protein RecA